MKTQLQKRISYEKLDVSRYINDYMSICNIDDLYMDYYNRKPLPEYQTELFNRAMYGLDVYSSGQLKRMNHFRKQRITKRHLEAREVLNKWKKDIVITLSNNIFSIFNKGNFKCLIDATSNSEDVKEQINLSFTELGITKEQIINKLIESRILPLNFYELDGSPNQKLTYYESTISS